jgi:hypothetical protein
MTPLEKCMQSLAAIVRFDDPDGVVLMEEAIYSLIEATGTDSIPKIVVLDVLAEEVARKEWNPELSQLIQDYITQQRKGLAGEDD